MLSSSLGFNYKDLGSPDKVKFSTLASQVCQCQGTDGKNDGKNWDSEA